MKKLLLVLGMTAAMAAQAELVQQFKDPTFSGNGWSSQVLTLEQMRQSAKNSVDSKAAADKASAESAAANTPLAKFIALFTGQVYSQLATQLTNNLFKDCVIQGMDKIDNFVWGHRVGMVSGYVIAEVDPNNLLLRPTKPILFARTSLLY